jgi:transcriptional regulator with XRE-family HTH domain
MTELVADREAAQGDPVVKLGSRLKAVRLRSGMSLREVARQLGVSPSFISQLENGKSQPSVATLYSIAQLFAKAGDSAPVDASVEAVAGAVSRSDLGSPADAWPQDDSGKRISIVEQAKRPRLVMDSGVVWEQLATNSDQNLDFMEIIYPPGSSSTNDGRMLRHQGMEYGYLLSGTLEITYGFDTYTLRAGESMSLDSSVPHLLTNPGTTSARGIWAVHHCGPVNSDD